MKNHNSSIVLSRCIAVFWVALWISLPIEGSAQGYPYPQQNTGRTGSNPYPSSSSGIGRTGTGMGMGSSFGSGMGGTGIGSTSGKMRTKSSRTSRQSSKTTKKGSHRKGGKTTPTPTPGAPARATGAAGVSLAGGAKKKSAGTSFAAEESAPPTIALSSLIQSDSLYFSPTTVETGAGQRFPTPLHFFNAGSHAIDRLDVWIHYPPEILDPVWFNVDPLKEQADGPIERKVIRASGYIHLAAKFNPPLTTLLVPLGSINWTALQGPAQARVAFEAPPGEATGVYEGKTNVLENEQILNRGLVSLDVRIGGDPFALNMDEDDAFRIVNVGEDPNIPGDRTNRGVHLGLVPKQTRVRPGDVSTMDVVLINPDNLEFDELRARIRFDPDDAEILDADENNYITEGVNLYDGGFHDKLPFDLHAANQVDQAHGAIDYIVGNQQRIYPYPSGTIARIVFRMKRDAGSATFWFEATAPDGKTMASDVRARGRSLLGPGGGQPADALHNARVSVAPL